jgi:hypothetical protein
MRKYSSNHIAAREKWRKQKVEMRASHAPVVAPEERKPLKKSLADVYAVLASQGEHAPLSLFDRERRELHVSSLAELPINSPLFIDSSVVERISDDIVLFSDRDEERVLHLSTLGSSGPSTAPSTLSSTPQEEHDSPLLLRPSETFSSLYGGEEVQLCVTEVPVRLVRGTRVEAGYLLATNYRVCFFAASLLSSGESVTARVLLQHLTKSLSISTCCFPLLFARIVKSERIQLFSTADERDAHFNAAVASTRVRVGLVDGRVLSFDFPHTHLERNAKLASSLLALLDRNATRPFAFSFRPTNPYTFDGWSCFNFFREFRRQFTPAPAVFVLDENDFSSAPVIGAQAGKTRPTEWRVASVGNMCRL